MHQPPVVGGGRKPAGRCVSGVGRRLGEFVRLPVMLQRRTVLKDHRSTEEVLRVLCRPRVQQFPHAAQPDAIPFKRVGAELPTASIFLIGRQKCPKLFIHRLHFRVTGTVMQLKGPAVQGICL
jgi:hypothetical protein